LLADQRPVADNFNGLLYNCFYREVIELLFPKCVKPPWTLSNYQVKCSANETIVKLVYREIFKSIEETLMEYTESARGTVRVIQGPAGAGKSMTLLYACHYARQLGWIVVYVPTLAAFVSESASVLRFCVNIVGHSK
jgi:hypothetical protein